ncbi:MAG: hypothetical protein JNG85_11720 [Spirochaetaceae bacterium]|nr:hypothetical protein [Spirochaetaceae bacterium]
MRRTTHRPAPAFAFAFALVLAIASAPGLAAQGPGAGAQAPAATGPAKGGAADKVGALLRSGKLAEARSAVEAFLAADPADVDARMMLGNVILNEHFAKSGEGGISLEANRDESIFSPDMGYMKGAVVILPRKVAEEVAALWLGCLADAPAREDIQLGVCAIYTRALMTEELVVRMRRVAEAYPDGRHMYTMMDYVGQLREWAGPKVSLPVAEALLSIYPNRAGIASDVAAAFAAEGRLSEAAALLDKAAGMPGVDEYLHGNRFYVNYLLGDYDRALAALKADATTGGLWRLFEGLLRRLRGEASWRDSLKGFLADPGKDRRAAAGAALARFLLSPEDKDDYASYLASIAPERLVFEALLHRRAVERFPEATAPRLSYGLAMARAKSYAEALRVLEPARFAGGPAEEAETATILRAWSLEDSGRGAEADAEWLALASSGNVYFRSASAYFRGKRLAAAGETAKALVALKAAGVKADQGKYANYIANLIGRLEGR